MSQKTLSHALLGIVFFLIPIVGVLFLMWTNQEIVPRDHVKTFFGSLDGASVIRSPAALAQIYHMATAGALTALVSLAVLVQLARWQSGLLAPLKTLGLRWMVPVLAVLCLYPIERAINESGFIDDAAIRDLFKAAGLLDIKPSQLFNYDARVLGGLIFLTYAVAAATSSLAAISIHAGQAATRDADARRLMSIVRGTLLLTSVVLLAAVVTAKLRLDVGALMLSSREAVDAYRTIAGAVMNYWAIVLSAGLALIYLAPAIYLYRYYTPSPSNGPGDVAHMSWLTSENLGRLARLLAILSPPIVNTLVDFLLPSTG